MEKIKTCSKCKQELLLDAFSKDKNKKDGMCCVCKKCKKVTWSAWAKANPEKKKASDAAWAKANPEKKKASDAAWAKANPEKKAAWAKANPEKAKAAVAAWKKTNPEKRKAATTAWIKANPEKRKEADSSYIEKASDSYLLKLLVNKSNLCRTDIPHELIEQKREQVQIYRMSRQIKQHLNKKENQK